MPKAPSWDSDRKNGRPARKRHRTTISWSAAGPENLSHFITLLTEMGCAVMLGRTSDGGALSLLVLAGNDKYREYITTPQDILPTFQDLLSDLELPDLPEQPA